jgi:hypothetical protein
MAISTAIDVVSASGRLEGLHGDKVSEPTCRPQGWKADRTETGQTRSVQIKKYADLVSPDERNIDGAGLRHRHDRTGMVPRTSDGGCCHCTMAGLAHG